MRTTRKKKILALLLAVLMVVSLLPGTALAAEGEDKRTVPLSFFGR